MSLFLKVCLLLCVAGALAERHRPAVAVPAEAAVPEEGQDRPPSDVIGDVALRDRLEAVHRARALRLLRLRRQQQQPAGSKPEPGSKLRLSQNAPAVASRAAAGGPAAYDDEGDDNYEDDDAAGGDSLYGDEDEEDDKRGDVRGGGDRTKGGERRSGGRVRNSHRDPYTDVDDDDNRGGENYGADRRKEKQSAEEPEDRGEDTDAAGGADDHRGSAKPRDDQRLRKRMDCIVDRVNHCIEWCRLKPTDTRLRQNRDNEPCRYWKGDAKNKWMQSGICRNGRCS